MMKLVIRRRVSHANICQVWLVVPLGGGATTGLMHGTMTEEHAKEIERIFGIPTEWEDYPLSNSPDDPDLMPENLLKKQSDQIPKDTLRGFF